MHLWLPGPLSQVKALEISLRPSLPLFKARHPQDISLLSLLTMANTCLQPELPGPLRDIWRLNIHPAHLQRSQPASVCFLYKPASFCSVKLNSCYWLKVKRCPWTHSSPRTVSSQFQHTSRPLAAHGEGWRNCSVELRAGLSRKAQHRASLTAQPRACEQVGDRSSCLPKVSDTHDNVTHLWGWLQMACSLHYVCNCYYFNQQNLDHLRNHSIADVIYFSIRTRV
jgi:hypothetical protein